MSALTAKRACYCHDNRLRPDHSRCDGAATRWLVCAQRAAARRSACRTQAAVSRRNTCPSCSTGFIASILLARRKEPGWVSPSSSPSWICMAGRWSLTANPTRALLPRFISWLNKKDDQQPKNSDLSTKGTKDTKKTVERICCGFFVLFVSPRRLSDLEVIK